MGSPAKFLFDIDFAAPAQDPNAAKEHVPTPEEIAKRVADAEARSYRAGFDAAQREAKVMSDRQMAQALAGIEASVGTIAKNFATVENRMETEAVEVALAVARKLCTELMAAEPLTEITSLVSDCFRHLTSTPHIVVRINDALYDSARERVEQLARRSGFEGRLVILAEPDIPTGDCKIEWADGGVTLDRAAIDIKINELVGRYLASRNGGQS
ncbi:FliH/SctL family protein [Bradyrhizobium sp. SYSU BS000235]|uniref:FliH/SctL family protein n=1 Tax=Bradyrhizobium sp. SYSU BS000235 TaxID=3411332 RepID=UPI003C7851E1